MWTLSYRGYFIHGYCDRHNVRISGLPHGTGTKECTTLVAAKQYIGNIVNSLQRRAA